MSAPHACAYCGAAVNIRCCEYGREWASAHADDCPVVSARAGLLALTTMAPDVQRAAAAEYELGGDQERELCACRPEARSPTVGATAEWAEQVAEPREARPQGTTQVAEWEAGLADLLPAKGAGA